MKICVLYDSVTGNTKQLAEVIEKKYAALLTENLAEADVVFLGSWTDKGSFSEKMKEQAEKIHEKKVFIFGTCGFGGSSEYYERLFERAAALLDESNTVIGHYYCQGKMPMQVRQKYENMRTSENAPQVDGFIRNFDCAMTHPDREDLKKAQEFALSCISHASCV